MTFLTIDDVPSSRCVEKLDWLRENKIPAVLFIWGEHVAGNEALLVSAIQQGFRLGNHSWSHPFFSKLEDREVVSQIVKTHALIQSLYDQAGIKWKRKYFRFPYLDRGRDDGQAQWIQELLSSFGYAAPPAQGDSQVDTYCSYDQREYYLNNPEAPDGLDKAEAILARIGPGQPGPQDIVLIHDHDYSHDLFFTCIKRYRELGVKFGLP